MKIVISIAILVAVLFGGYSVWEYWDKVSHDRDVAEKQAAAQKVVPEQLSGMPSGLEPTYQAAQKNGATGIRNWLKMYGAKTQDPRKAWIELDYAVAISHDDPVEAKKVYAEVKNRIPSDSPVSGRVKELERAFQ
jgi:hypothetical protein